ILIALGAGLLRLLLLLTDGDGVHGRNLAALAVDELVRGDLFELERDWLEAWTAKFVAVMKRDQIFIVLPEREIAVHFGHERTAAAGQELGRIGHMLDRVTQHHDTRAAG